MQYYRYAIVGKTGLTAGGVIEETTDQLAIAYFHSVCTENYAYRCLLRHVSFGWNYKEDEWKCVDESHSGFGITE